MRRVQGGLSDAVRFQMFQLFFVFAREEESLRDEFALAKGERVPCQETMVILYLLCLNMFPLIKEYTRSSIVGGGRRLFSLMTLRPRSSY